MTDIVRYEPRGAALEAMKSKDPEILLSGAAGTGKSLAALYKLHYACLMKPKVRAMILRKTHSSLTSSTLVTFREKVAKEALESGTVKFYGGSAQSPAAFQYGNGSTILVGGLDRASRLLSVEIDICFVDEAIEVTDEDLDVIVSRLRNGVLSYQQLLLATNPGPPQHHLKRRADSGRTRMLYSKHEDNPRLYNAKTGEWTAEGKAYIARLESLSGVRYERLRWGRWCAADGLIYENWDESVHLIDPFPVPDDWQRWWGIDFGFTAPFVWQEFAEDNDGRLYLLREHVKSRMIVEDHVREIKRMVIDGRGEWRTPQPTAILCDHDAEDRATFERHMEMATLPAKKGRTAGIQALQARLEKAADGKPRFMVFRNALKFRDPVMDEAVKPIGLAEEIPGYVWAVKPGSSTDLKEEPVKENDHSLDASRYVVAHRDMRGAPNIRWLGGRR